MKRGFTLAEVMIVIAIIGVVAALVLPGFIQDMGERINSNRQANIAQKITKSVELMTVNGDYQDIYNTEQFVNKLSKYLKIAKICHSNNIDECWPTKNVKTIAGGKYEVKNAQKGTDLHVRSEEDNVGLILADGASLILNFNPEASTPSAEGGFIPSKKLLPIGGGKFEEFAYTSNATTAIDFVMDVNGKTGPNQEPSEKGEYYDIRPFRIALFSKPDCASLMGTPVKGIGCVVNLGTNFNCITEAPYTGTNCWAGARETCNELADGFELPDQSTLLSVYKQASKYPSLPKSGQYFTSTITDGRAVKYVNFGNGGSNDVFKNDRSVRALCVGN